MGFLPDDTKDKLPSPALTLCYSPSLFPHDNACLHKVTSIEKNNNFFFKLTACFGGTTFINLPTQF